MVRMKTVAVLTWACALLLTPAAWAQQSASGIAGVVRGEAGLPIAGVTVEAASDALIEKVRAVLTDGQGQYKIVNLVPGAYLVTFRGTGFSTVRVQGIELTAGFTATVNGLLKVGSPTETVTVTAESSAVDTQSIRAQTVISSDVQAQVPSGTKDAQSVVTVTPGLTSGSSSDVGGSAGAYGGATSAISGGTYHGKGGIKTLFDGLRIENANGGGGPFPNSVLVGQTAVDRSGGSAESLASGVTINSIPKSGSNSWKFSASGKYTTGGLQAANLDDSLRSRGLQTPDKILTLYDAGGSIAGPLVKDKLWFIFAPRYWGDEIQIGGVFWNKTQNTLFYTPDLSRPATRLEDIKSRPIRFTWQASARNKLNFLADPQDACMCRSYANPQNTPPEATNGYIFRPSGMYQVTWSSPRTAKLLLEGGFGYAQTHWPQMYQPGVTVDNISILEQSTATRYGAMPTYMGVPSNRDRFDERFSAAYVTGSHAFKAGIQVQETVGNTFLHANQNINYTFNNQLPVSVTEWSTPYLVLGRIKADLGIFAQDQWTLKRLTLNYGLRFDYLNGHVGAQHVDPTQFVPFARDYPDVACVPCWKDLSPRVGVAYDLFGNARTALKVSLGKYMTKQDTAIPLANNPINTSVTSVNRNWNDANSNFVPDCTLTNPAANGECGAISDNNFGLNNPKATRWADDAISGWGVRDYTWDLTVELQRQLARRVSLTAGYYRNWFGNFRVTDNQAVDPAADFSPYCVTAPVDSRLPGGGGFPLCGLYDVSPARFGSTQNVVTQTSHFGQQTQVNDFFGLDLNAQFGRGGRIGGGMDFGRSVNDKCFIVDSPAQTLYDFSTAATPTYCHTVTPWSGTLQVKMNGSYPLPLPGDITLSGTFQTQQGPQITAIYTAPNTAITPSLGRNLSACGTRTPCTATVLLPLIQPGTQYEPRRYQADLRLSKAVKVGPRLRVQGNLDLYNLFNANYVTAINATFGPQWLKPLNILNGRSIQFSGNVNF